MDMPRTEEFSVERQSKARITVADIQREVAKDFGVEVADLKSKNRKRHFVRPRQVAMYLSKVFTPRSYPEIGRHFGGRDHSTVIHAYRLISKLIIQDLELKRKVEDLVRQFRVAELEGIQLVLPFSEAEICFLILSTRGGASYETIPPLLAEPAKAVMKSTQLTFAFMKPQVGSRIESLVPFVPQIPSALTNTDIFRAVADYYAVNPEALECPSGGWELQYCRQVAERLQIRLRRGRELLPEARIRHNSDLGYQLKGDHELMAHDISAIWNKITAPGYIPLV